jgi:predicted DsbA family dithiol-disulfide isomerase
MAISEAYFLDAKNVADVGILSDIAVDYGFDHAEARAIAFDHGWQQRVEQEAARSTAAGIRSVPHFVFGNSVEINGGRSEDEIALSTNLTVSHN